MEGLREGPAPSAVRVCACNCVRGSDHTVFWLLLSIWALAGPYLPLKHPPSKAAGARMAQDWARSEGVPGMVRTRPKLPDAASLERDAAVLLPRHHLLGLLVLHTPIPSWLPHDCLPAD